MLEVTGCGISFFHKIIFNQNVRLYALCLTQEARLLYWLSITGAMNLDRRPLLLLDRCGCWDFVMMSDFFVKEISKKL